MALDELEELGVLFGGPRLLAHAALATLGRGGVLLTILLVGSAIKVAISVASGRMARAFGGGGGPLLLLPAVYEAPAWASNVGERHNCV